MTEQRRLFTVILDFRGGTYVAQVEAEGVTAAARIWARRLDVKAIWGMGPAGKKALVQAMADSSLAPAPVEGATNVWCHHALVRGHGCLINIVETERSRARDARSARAG